MNPPPDPSHQRIEGHGVALRRLAHEDIEQVRCWRNDPAVNAYMKERAFITPQMQEQWFAGLDPRSQFYYVIESGGRDAGLANLKNCDFAAGEGEGGIFIAEPGLRDGHLGMAALLALYDFGFQALLLERIRARILAGNRRAIRFNEALGFRLQPGQEAEANQLYLLVRADFAARSARFRAFFSVGSG